MPINAIALNKQTLIKLRIILLTTKIDLSMNPPRRFFAVHPLKVDGKVKDLTFKFVKRIYGTSAILIGKGFMVPG